MHGANRLGSNSLLEALVTGDAAGRAAAARVARGEGTGAGALDRAGSAADEELSLDVEDLRASVQSLMWRAAGIERDAGMLEEAGRQLRAWVGYAMRGRFSARAGWEVQNLLTIGRAVLCAAWEREETRGVHCRTDFPRVDDQRWKRHLVLQGRIAAAEEAA